MSTAMRGTMLWFNEIKDQGVLLTEGGERLPVAGDAFSDGTRPKGRCAQASVTFEVVEVDGLLTADEVSFVSEASPRRARLRRRAPR
jgi:hypothetical protein